MKEIKLDILAFGAHPDDVELGCGGTIAKEISKGKKVGIIDLTRGELGTRGSGELRLVEAANSAKIQGIEIRENLGMADGFFQNDKAHQIEIAKIIRKYQPDVVLSNAVQDRHPDHGRGAEITIDACFLAGLEKIVTGQQIWRPRSIYHYIQFNYLTPDIVVDISAEMEVKLKAVKAYSTQFFNPESNENETIISSQGFLESISYRAQDLGRQSNCEYAEGFLAHQLPKVNTLFDFK